MAGWGAGLKGTGAAECTNQGSYRAAGREGLIADEDFRHAKIPERGRGRPHYSRSGDRRYRFIDDGARVTGRHRERCSPAC